MEQIIKDRLGHRLGIIRLEGNREVAFDRLGRKLGYYDGKYTCDTLGRRLTSGNTLSSLIMQANQ